MLSEEYGGRVELAKAYFRGLTDSVRRHFGGNGVIASMEHCNDFMLLGTEAVALGRVGDDFWCTDPSGDPNGTFWLQGCHMVHCAYNSLWMGSFIHPDWDMFQSTHPCAAFHAASRAVSGGPVYVSDSVGSHDFALLRRLSLPDGTVLRCEHHALPTRDLLFLDPLHVRRPDHAQDLESQQVLRRARRLQLPGRRVEPRGAAQQVRLAVLRARHGTHRASGRRVEAGQDPPRR